MGLNDNVDSEKKYDLYCEERKLLISIQRSSITQFDKSILTISAGGVALTATFLHFIQPRFETFWILSCGLVFLVLCMFTTMISFLLNHKACVLQQEYLPYHFGLNEENTTHSGKLLQRRILKLGGRIVCFNWCSIVFLFVGAILLSFFIVSNLDWS